MDADSPNSSTLSIRAQFNFQFNFFLQGGRRKTFFEILFLYENIQKYFRYVWLGIVTDCIHGGDIILIRCGSELRLERIFPPESIEECSWLVYMGTCIKKIKSRLCPSILHWLFLLWCSSHYPTFGVLYSVGKAIRSVSPLYLRSCRFAIWLMIKNQSEREVPLFLTLSPSSHKYFSIMYCA